MANNINFDELLKLKSQMKDLEENIDDFKEECCKEVASRLLAKVIKNTPVGRYEYTNKSGKKKKYKLGGTLRRGWTSKKGNINITKFGDTHQFNLENSVEYASYVEFGHRKRAKKGQPGKGWVEGKYILTTAEKEIEEISQKLIEKKINQRFGDVGK